MRYYLVIPQIKVQSANAISSPLTYGFPAITAFTGAIHSLNRKVAERFKVNLAGVGIVSHQCTPQIARPNTYSDWSFIQSRHPLKKDGGSPSIIEEGKTHLTLSLLVEVNTDAKDKINWNDEEKQQFCEYIYQQMMLTRLAGGSILSIGNKYKSINVINDPNGDVNVIRKIKIQLSPGFILMDRQAILAEYTQELQAQHLQKNSLDALIELCAIHIEPNLLSDEEPPEGQKVAWQVTRKRKGWLVPIPIGYKGITPEFGIGEVSDIRAPQYPTHFVESIYSMGEWVFINRIEDLNAVFWRYNTDLAQQLFLVSQEKEQVDEFI